MTIAEAREKCKNALSRVPRDVLIIMVLLLASSASFGLGYLAGLDAGQGGKGGILEAGQAPTPGVGVPAGSAGVVASKSGTRYYPPGCAGASRISDANKVWFVSAEAAEAAGYAPAANCSGL
ncbi:MAG TPA: hypothetical protein VMV62_01700 [Candidatus Paceibacterota bacterium]|nr:hypothetical protein [Candidatus Paceibacterota bacterium]